MIGLLHENLVFEDQVVYFRGNIYRNCTFRRCVLVVGDGGVDDANQGCELEACTWHLDMVISDRSHFQAMMNGLFPKVLASLPSLPVNSIQQVRRPQRKMTTNPNIHVQGLPPQVVDLTSNKPIGGAKTEDADLDFGDLDPTQR